MKITNIFNAVKNIARIYNPPTYVVNKQRTDEGVDGRLVSCVDKGSYIAEQYKVLRTNLYSLSPDKPLQTFTITSSQAQEGKTLSSCNLAYTLSLDKEKKTILIDCDMRRPSVHNIFGIQRKPGFSDILSGEIELEHFISRPTFGDLTIIPSGTIRTSPSEILSSARLKSIIGILRQRYDFIFFDTPPVLNVTDSTVLGAMCDAVLFVVKAGVTQKAMIEEAFNMLREAQVKPKACILTNVHFMLDSYYYYYKYKYYKYSERKE